MDASGEMIQELAKEIADKWRVRDRSCRIPAGVSNRHIHLSRADLDALFGPGYELTVHAPLKQPGQYAAKEQVSIAGPKGSFANVRILGPVRKESQVEISRTDAFVLGVRPPVRNSGDVSGSASLCAIGPKGMLVLDEKVICARRHIHMTPKDAQDFGVADGDVVAVEASGEKQVIFGGVLVRVNEEAALEFHVDTDEANTAELRNNDMVRIVSKQG